MQKNKWRTLRESAGLTREQLIMELARRGEPKSVSSIVNWEAGRQEPPYSVGRLMEEIFKEKLK